MSSPDIREALDAIEAENERRVERGYWYQGAAWAIGKVRALLDQPASKPDDAGEVYELWDRDSGNIVGQFDLQRLVETVASLAAQGMKPEDFSARLTNPEDRG